MFKISDIKINIPKYPKLIIDTLKRNGFDAYIVGGCVRDEILCKIPSDYDITTNAKPDEIKSIFKRTIDTGIKHGTVSVLFYEDEKPNIYEVTTYRIDGEYEDGRHPSEVKFVDDLKEDLLRRDFTVNAMAYNDDRGLVDEFGGLVDIEKKLIRAVGNPFDRFTEDALRLLRAIRFSAKLGFRIEDETKSAIPKLAENLRFVSKERVQVELTKTLTSANPEYSKLIFELSLAPYVCEDFEKIDSGKFDKELSVHLAYACLLYKTDILLAGKILKELKFDNANATKILSLLESKKCLTKLKKEFSEGAVCSEFEILVKELIDYLKYDLTYDFIRLISTNEKDQILIDSIKETVDKFYNKKTPIFVKDIKINGNDLINIGFRGEEIGTALRNLQKIVFKNSKYNDKKKLNEIALNAYKKYKGAAYEL